MSQASATIRINAPRSKVWEALSDIGAVHRFHPTVENSYSTSENHGGIGAARRCEFYGGGHVDEVVTDWAEGEMSAFSVAGGFGPAKSISGFTLLRSEGSDTVAKIQLDYELKLGLLGKVLDVAVARRQFRKLIGRVLEGLKYHVETGGAVEDSVPERARAA